MIKNGKTYRRRGAASRRRSGATVCWGAGEGKVGHSLTVRTTTSPLPRPGGREQQLPTTSPVLSPTRPTIPPNHSPPPPGPPPQDSGSNTPEWPPRSYALMRLNRKEMPSACLLSKERKNTKKVNETHKIISVPQQNTYTHTFG